MMRRSPSDSKTTVLRSLVFATAGAHWSTSSTGPGITPTTLAPAPCMGRRRVKQFTASWHDCSGQQSSKQVVVPLQMVDWFCFKKIVTGMLKRLTLSKRMEPADLLHNSTHLAGCLNTGWSRAEHSFAATPRSSVDIDQLATGATLSAGHKGKRRRLR